MSQLTNKIKYFGKEISQEEFDKIKKYNCELIHDCIETRGPWYRHGAVEYSNDTTVYWAYGFTFMYFGPDNETLKRLSDNGYRIGMVVPHKDKFSNELSLAMTVSEIRSHDVK